MYATAPCNAAFRTAIEVDDGKAVVRIEAEPGHFHGGGGLHGHILFKALDDAAFFAANSRVREELVLTAEFHVRFLRPVQEGRLRAEGRVVQRSRRLVVAEAVVLDERGREVARGSGSFLPSGLPLVEVPGYLAP